MSISFGLLLGASVVVSAPSGIGVRVEIVEATLSAIGRAAGEAASREVGVDIVSWCYS